MGMKFSDQELTAILARPGYAIADGSGLARTLAIGRNPVQGHSATPKPKQPVLWRSERDYMAAVFAECAVRATQRPEYAMLFHIPNENSHRQPGVRGGVPDLMLAVQRGGFGGLFVELKIGSNKPSGKQRDVIAQLRDQGYCCHVIWDSVDEVVEAIEKYLDYPMTKTGKE